jgi:hypothetical protein
MPGGMPEGMPEGMPGGMPEGMKSNDETTHGGPKIVEIDDVD